MTMIPAKQSWSKRDGDLYLKNIKCCLLACRVLQGLLEAMLGSCRKQNPTGGSASLALQQNCLEFLSRLLRVVPIALQTLRGVSVWDRLYGPDLFFYRAETASGSTTALTSEPGLSEVRDEAFGRACKGSGCAVKVLCRAEEQSQTVKVRIDVGSSKRDGSGEAKMIDTSNCCFHTPNSLSILR